mgnify:FL=1
MEPMQGHFEICGASIFFITTGEDEGSQISSVSVISFCLFVCFFFSEIREREPTLKRKFSDVHGNENGVESSTKIVTNENLNGDHKTDDNNSTEEPLLSGPEVSLPFNPALHICWKWSGMVDVFTSLLNNV